MHAMGWWPISWPYGPAPKGAAALRAHVASTLAVLARSSGLRAQGPYGLEMAAATIHHACPMPKGQWPYGPM